MSKFNYVTGYLPVVTDEEIHKKKLKQRFVYSFAAIACGFILLPVLMGSFSTTEATQSNVALPQKNQINTVSNNVNYNAEINSLFSESHSNQATPPPLPQTTKWFVAVNDKASGPYSLNEIKELASNHKVNASSLAWKTGMSRWQSVDGIEGLRSIFKTNNTAMPPALPKLSKK